MKKIYIILSVIITMIIGALVVNRLMDKIELEISFFIAQRHTSKDTLYKGGLSYYDWFIVSSEEQRKNLEEEGYILPSVDFNRQYIIVSRYKICKLYRTRKINRHCGVPDGKVVFDKNDSNEDYYYVYLMSNVMLSQGIG